MQRRLDEETPDLVALVHTGDFRALIDKLLDGFLAKRFNANLIKIGWSGTKSGERF